MGRVRRGGGQKIEGFYLVGPHAACADVADLAALHDVVQCLHRLLHGHVRIEAVDL